MSFFFSVIIRTKCYNFTVSIASIDNFDLVIGKLKINNTKKSHFQAPFQQLYNLDHQNKRNNELYRHVLYLNNFHKTGIGTLLTDEGGKERSSKLV